MSKGTNSRFQLDLLDLLGPLKSKWKCKRLPLPKYLTDLFNLTQPYPMSFYYFVKQTLTTDLENILCRMPNMASRFSYTSCVCAKLEVALVIFIPTATSK